MTRRESSSDSVGSDGAIRGSIRRSIFAFLASIFRESHRRETGRLFRESNGRADRVGVRLGSEKLAVGRDVGIVDPVGLLGLDGKVEELRLRAAQERAHLRFARVPTSSVRRPSRPRFKKGHRETKAGRIRSARCPPAFSVRELEGTPRFPVELSALCTDVRLTPCTGRVRQS